MENKDKTNQTEDRQIGYKLLFNAIKMESSLAELLRVETKIVKRRLKMSGNNLEDIKVNRRNLRYILYMLTILDNRIEAGMKLIGK